VERVNDWIGGKGQVGKGRERKGKEGRVMEGRGERKGLWTGREAVADI
jgi:hypothetical protein